MSKNLELYPMLGTIVFYALGELGAATASYILIYAGSAVFFASMIPMWRGTLKELTNANI